MHFRVLGDCLKAALLDVSLTEAVMHSGGPSPFENPGPTVDIQGACVAEDFVRARRDGPPIERTESR